MLKIIQAYLLIENITEHFYVLYVYLSMIYNPDLARKFPVEYLKYKRNVSSLKPEIKSYNFDLSSFYLEH